MKKQPFALLIGFMGLLLISSGCKRKENNPLLGTPDSAVTNVQMYVRGVDNTQPPQVTVLFQSVANSSFRMTDLLLANFAVLQDQKPMIATNYGPATNYPFAVMLVIDRSGSMTASFGSSSRAQEANNAATVFLNNLPATAQAGLIEFSGTVQVTVPMTTNKQSVITAVNLSTESVGGTALYDAIIVGAQELSKATGFRLLVFLTDGDDSASSHTAEDAQASLGSIGTVASGVVIGGDVSDTAKMQAIVDVTGGTLSTSLDPTDLANDLDAILNGGLFDDIYALTFRRRNDEPNIRIYVSYGTNTASVDMSVYR
jgi:hypothetical protein